ncbi:MAG: uroporphyrinogen-III synthase [Burkholderiales bacterium]
MASELRGRGILVTRPREQAAGLARLIEQAGGRAHLFPAIDIQDLPPPGALSRLREFDLAIFISPTAVSRVFRHLKTLPSQVRAAAVGAGTRRELERHGVTQVISPSSGADSEALLAQPELEIFRNIVIFRGEDGRALLGETLAGHGARVEYAACYRRARPQVPGKAWKPGEIDAVTVSSAQGLANLFEMLDPGLLQATPLFVPHARIAEQGRARSVREVVIAGPSDEEMLDRLVAYFRSHD